MQHRRLGRTGLDVAVLSVGTEYLKDQPLEVVDAVIGQAIDRGVNYFDVVFAFPDYLDRLCQAFQGHRDRLLLTGHLGSTVKDGQYCRNRSPVTSEPFFRDVLSRLKTEYVDILYLHNFNTLKEWDTITRPRGQLELALRHKAEGRARFIGISAHYVEVVRRAVESGHVDVVMFPVNLFGHAMPGRRELLELCTRHDVGLVAMKPYAGGRLLTATGTYRVPSYQSGGESYKVKFPRGITPAQCLSYTLAQVGVTTALTGAQSAAELDSSLRAVEATEQEQDFSGLLTAFGRYEAGECVYCNHCLPCPVAIDIAQVIRLVDAARWGVSDSLRLEYRACAVTASACTGCGACTARCPFGVDTAARVREAVPLFGS